MFDGYEIKCPIEVRSIYINNAITVLINVISMWPPVNSINKMAFMNEMMWWPSYVSVVRNNFEISSLPYSVHTRNLRSEDEYTSCSEPCA